EAMSTITQRPMFDSPAGADRPIDQKLSSAWGRERRYYHLRGLAWLLPVLIVLFVLEFLLDWWVEVPRLARLIMLLSTIGVCALYGFQVWWRYLRRYDAARVALQV